MSGPPRTPNQQVVPRPVRPLDERVVCILEEPIDDATCRRPIRRATSRARSTSAGSRRTSSRPTAPGSTADPDAAAVHDHPAAAEHHRLAPPRPRPADGGRGPDDPPRPDARPSRRSSCPVSTTPRSPPSSSSTGSSPRRARAARRLGRERYLERMRAFVADDPRGHARPAAPASARRSTGAACATRWTTARRRPSGSRSRRLYERGPRLSDRGARQLVPGLPDERQRPRGHRARPETGTLWSVRYHLIDEATGEPIAGRDHHGRDDPARDDPRRHRGRGPSRRPALPRARRPPGPDPVRRARRPDHRRRGRRPGVRDRRGQDHPGPRPRRPRDRASATVCPMPTILADDGDDHRHRDALRRARPVRGARARSSPTSRPRGDLAGRARRTRWSSGAASAATTSSSRGSRPSGSSGRRRSRHAALEATRSGRTRILPERFEKTWEHWLTDIRDWNVSRQLWWGHRIPAWYCPDGHVTVVVRRGRPGRLRRLRPAGGRAPAGPRHLRHVVQLGAVAVLDPRLARRHARLPDATTRRRSWRPATTSSSSGSPG